VVGSETDKTVSAILKVEASLQVLQIAVRYLRGAGSELDRLGHPLPGKVVELSGILSAGAAYAGSEA
jgi:hypothetical protein